MLAKIEESKKKAHATGNIIELRVSDLNKKTKETKLKYSWYQTPTKIGI